MYVRVLLNVSAKECERLGMTIGMGDYTIAWIGNGYFTDKVANTPGMSATVLNCEKKLLFSGDEEEADENVLAIVSFSDSDCTEPVIIFEKGKGVLNPVKGLSEAYIIKTDKVNNSIDPLNPDCGKLLVELYFEEFFRRCPDVSPETFDCFFQDELMFGTNTKYLWSEFLRDEISKKYGYDILGFIPHLFFNLGNITPKIRLDTADVKTALIEKNYFIPIYEFHASRGMIYGCDQSGRGKEPDEFSDYFRTVRWFTAPGNDTPGRAADLIKVKVNSSVAHLYNRPRVWLEGYHSSGWGTTLESITAPTSDNFIFGANLLNLHGLYYSTNGGFFEWAPPDFHFRMPYWDDEKSWLDKYKRMAQLLSTGKHRADAAIYYPVSSFDYGENHKNCIKTTFSCAEYLFSKGIDFDFIDFQSIENSVCEDGLLKTPEESFRVLIFAGVDCIRFSALKKAEEFLKNGGKVIFCSITPFASDNAGLQDKQLGDMISSMLMNPNCILAATDEIAFDFINKNVSRSFLPEYGENTEKTYVHTRVHGDSCLYFVRYVKRGSICRFESSKKFAYLLDTEKGEAALLTGTKIYDGFTYIRMPLEENDDTLILFTDEHIECDKEINTLDDKEEIIKETVILADDWDFSLIPTLDNTYGDYYLPAGGMIGAEARFFDVAEARDIPESYEFTSLPFNRSEAIIKIEAPKERRALSDFVFNSPEVLSCNEFLFRGEEYKVKTEELDDRYYYNASEYTESLHEQGHHGLKGKVYDDNIYFSSDTVFFTYVYAPEDTSAILITGNIKPEFILLDKIPLTEGLVELKKGKHLLCVSYKYDKDEMPDYRNRGNIKRTSVHFVKENYRKNTEPLCVSSFVNPDYFRFSSSPDEKKVFCFRFNSVPAFSGFTGSFHGKLIKAFNNNESMDISFAGRGHFGADTYTATPKTVFPDVSEVIFFIEAEEGYENTAVIPCPVRLSSKKGKMHCTDLTVTGALINFSGKAVYEKKVNLEKLYPDERFYIDIENAATTINIEINGKTACIFTHKPFYSDITEYIRNGENEIKITVSNTLCNHYSTIPSKYSNFPRDASWGLMSPVKIIITEKTL